jgi:hypothetical protein
MTFNSITEAPELFQKAVEKLAERPTFLAHLLSRAFDGDVSTKRIAVELGCSEASALRLALMRVPRADRQLFRDDLSRIVQSTGVDRARLLAVIKQAQVLPAFAIDDRAQGMLLAARDVIPDPDEREE